MHAYNAYFSVGIILLLFDSIFTPANAVIHMIVVKYFIQT